MSILRTKKGDMNWIIIGLVLGLVALIVIIGLISKGFNLGVEATSCATLRGDCKTTLECRESGGYVTASTDCKSEEKICCTKGLG